MKWPAVLLAFFILIGYAVLGGLIFQALEQENETKLREQVHTDVAKFLSTYSCMTLNDLAHINELEQVIFEGGFQISDNGTLLNITRWDYPTSIFVAIELLATIGYKPAAPKSVAGRAFIVIFAFVGIPPFMLTVIGLGRLLNLIIDKLIKLVRRCFNKCEPVDDPPLTQKRRRRRLIIIRAVVIALTGYGIFVLIPSASFMEIEGWTYGEAVYYSSITLITVGFSDFVPGYGLPADSTYSGTYRLAVGIWIVVLISWFASVVVTIKGAIYQTTLRAGAKVVGAVKTIGTEMTYPPELEPVVYRTGATSAVTIVPGKRRTKFSSWFAEKPKDGPKDTRIVPIDRNKKNKGRKQDSNVFMDQNALSFTSNVKIVSR